MEVVKEERGIITKISVGGEVKSITIQRDDGPFIVEAYEGIDYSQFSVGQRVVHVTYAWRRPFTKEDKREFRGMMAPKELTYGYGSITYDEAEYDQTKESSKRI